MASSSSFNGEIPYEDDEIIETMSVCFDQNVDLLDLDVGIDLLGYLIADIEPGVGGVKATLLAIWRNLGQIRIIRAKKNVYTIRVGSEKLASRLIEGGPWNVKAFAFPFDTGHYTIPWTTWNQTEPLFGFKLMAFQGRCLLKQMKPAFTLPHHPLEFPYLPKHDLRHTTRRNNSDKTKIQIEPVIVPSTLHLSLPRTDNDLPSASSLPTAPSDSSDPRVTPSDLSSVSLSVPVDLSSGTMTHRKRLDLWHPDTNGTMFRNGSITMAINGIKLDSHSWADPNVIPPWLLRIFLNMSGLILFILFQVLTMIRS
ncbi:hypothetical protein M0R45_000527 [Rubus argutus]|uniref:DUF4283 domain-containing protein n=1 Tax=Rubus argutus TaxID=59490 RepID=A0AAW1VKK2_RUBAR